MDGDGRDEVLAYADHLQDYSERITRAAIRDWPDGSYKFEDVLELVEGDELTLVSIRMMATIDGDHIMLTDANPDWDTKDPKALGGITASLSLYVEDADAAQAHAVASGATEKMPVADMFWGDRMGCVVDPFGHQWSFLTHTRDLTDAEIQKGFEDMMANGCG